MSNSINFNETYRFNTLFQALISEPLSLEEWVTIFTRLYPKSARPELTNASHVSFFAHEINKYNHSRSVTEMAAKTGATAVMIGGLRWVTKLPSTTIIGCASLTVLLLDLALNYFSPIIFDPQIGFPAGQVSLTQAQQTQWQAYRKRWLKQAETAQLSEANEHKQALTRDFAIGVVLSFAIGLTLATEVVSVALIVNLVGYLATLAFSSSKARLNEGVDGAPDEELNFQLSQEAATI